MTASHPLCNSDAGKAIRNYEDKSDKQQAVSQFGALNFQPSALAPAGPAVGLWDYQRETVEGVAVGFAQPCPARAMLVVLPTGAGKTTVAAELARRMARKALRVWFLVHRSELLDQAAARFRAFGLPVGIIAAGYPPNPSCAVQVIMVQTLVNRLAAVGADEHPAYIFVDECHHAAASQYAAAFAPFPQAKIIGLTATPERTDKRGLGDTFDRLLQPVSTEALIARGRLVKPLYYAAEADVAGLRARAGEFVAAEQFERLDKPKLYAQVVEKWQAHGRGLPTICFCINVQHSIATAAAFNAAGVAAAHLDGETPTAERAQILADFAAGKYTVLCNVALFTEGFDLPELGCVIVNRATKSRALWHQMVGRAARPTAGFTARSDAQRLAEIAASSKPRCVVIDHGANLARHGWWEAPIEYTLELTAPKGRKSAALDVAPMKECRQCGLYTSSQTRVCSECAAPFPTLIDRAVEAVFTEAEYGGGARLPTAKTPKPRRIDLWPVDLQQYYHTPAKMSAQQIMAVQRLAGYAPGWADMVLARKAEWDRKGVRAR